MCLLGLLTGVLGIGVLVILIWVPPPSPPPISPLNHLYIYQGSVVVFGSWPDWTSEDVTSEDYCKELPMHFAFGILVTAWVSIQWLYIISMNENPEA